ncbi:hypothetical protein NDU88_007970 [Pleurodeles waltl]|uniref:Uncharacterized protein n=1 Tax=Pleurodeles waltl TaxID=8319 RepID=A0AAV7PT01_PLEWA|nr:hypothetical protein NDU88_007970 [Pleurodeles waltl]
MVVARLRGEPEEALVSHWSEARGGRFLGGSLGSHLGPRTPKREIWPAPRSGWLWLGDACLEVVGDFCWELWLSLDLFVGIVGPLVLESWLAAGSLVLYGMAKAEQRQAKLSFDGGRRKRGTPGPPTGEV